MFPPLTKRQKEILEYIKVFNELKGYSPSLQDIKKHFRLSAISTVHEHIQNLQEKGYIHKEINQARSIRTIEPDAGKSEFTELPILGAINSKDQLKKIRPSKNILVHKSMLAKSGKHYAVIVANKNMEEFGLFEGDTVIAVEHQGKTIKAKSLIIAKIVGDRITLGKVVKENNRTVFKPANTKIKIKSYRSFSLQGRVVGLIRHY